MAQYFAAIIAVVARVVAGDRSTMTGGLSTGIYAIHGLRDRYTVFFAYKKCLVELRRKLVNASVSRYQQFDTYLETIKQELRPAVCELLTFAITTTKMLREPRTPRQTDTVHNTQHVECVLLFAASTVITKKKYPGIPISTPLCLFIIGK